MTDTRPDDAAVVAELAAMSKEALRDLIDARIWFRDDAPSAIRRTFHARQRIAREMLDEN
ncbi:MAG: hypothetical protein KUL87_03925 [Pseudomonas sp.]|nr:hypothetical protein [Pseudomonas sp.]